MHSALCALICTNGQSDQSDSLVQRMELWLQWLSMAVCALAGLAFLMVFGDLVKRAEHAASRAEAAAKRVDPEFAVIGSDSDQTVMRMAAKWGADVLSSIANGHSGAEAVRRATPRIVGGLSSLHQEDVGSEVSTEELPALSHSNGENWILHASQAVTPVPEVRCAMDNAQKTEAWNAAAATSFNQDEHFMHRGLDRRSAIIHRPVAVARRRSRSPPHERHQWKA